MKGKINFKRIISYLLTFAMIFSTVQLKKTKTVKAADDGDTTKAEELIIKADNKELTVDQLGNEYFVENINSGTGKFYISVNQNIDNGAWKITDITSTDADMTQNTTGSGESLVYEFTPSADKSSGFYFIIKLENSNTHTTKTYTIHMYYDRDETTEFSKIVVSNVDNVRQKNTLTYDQADDDGYYRTTISKDWDKVKLEVYDYDGNLISSNIKYNDSTSNELDVTGGDNPVTIDITTGTIETRYKLILTKPGEAALESLTPSSGSLSPSFNSAVYDYDLTVDTNVENISFTPVSVDNSSSITINGVTVNSGKKSANIALDEGKNKVTVIVTTKEGEVATYIINVTRTEKERSSYLSALTLSSGSLEPGFNSQLTEYNVSVDNDVSSIYITPTAIDANAIIRVNGTKVTSGVPSKYINLDEGPNTINIRVVDDAGNSTTYILKVSRKYGEDNVNLNSLSLTKGKLSPSFDPETYLYSATVDRNVDNVRVNFESQNEDAQIFINDKEYKSGQQSDKIPLTIGANLITVKVIAEDGTTTTTYKISVIRGEIEGRNDWVLVSGNWTFYDGYGKQIKNDWVKYDNKWYRLDVNGHLITGWFREGDDWYYFRSDGQMLTGWMYEKGYWYYLHENGQMAYNKWYTLDTHTYYFNELGQMQTGWMLYGGRWYYLGKSGVMQKGWITYDKNKYYLNADGTMKNGWIFTGTTWYYLDSTGKMVYGWQTINGHKYYFDSKGAMKTGVIFLDGQWINLNNL